MNSLCCKNLMKIAVFIKFSFLCVQQPDGIVIVKTNFGDGRSFASQFTVLKR